MYSASLLRTPEVSLRWIPVWRRNLLVWRKLALASVLGNIADPLLYMLALGYGIGAFVPEVGGMIVVTVDVSRERDARECGGNDERTF